MIHAALDQRGYLSPGETGLGFAVGQEWLPLVFANRGVHVTASDMPEQSLSEGWATTNQHAANLDVLFHPNCISRDAFYERVKFRPVDMTDLSSLESESQDFIWSSCAIEHLGTLDRGIDFVKQAMRPVKPGGIAVHTTEFNCTSNDATVVDGWNVIYRQRDIELLGRELRSMRCALVSSNFDAGDHQYDMDYDEPPYLVSRSPHLKLMIDGYVSTSFVLVVKKAW